MAKRESTFKNMVLTLFLVALVAAAALGGVYNLTKPDIDKALKRKTQTAVKMVLPKFDNNPAEEMYEIKTPEGDVVQCFPASQNGQPVGKAVKSFTNTGYSGRIVVMVGFLPDGSIFDTFVLSHKETPGLGTKMKEPKFKNQFKNQSPAEFELVVNKDGGPVDAITAATISSRAFCDAVQRAYDALQNDKK